MVVIFNENNMLLAKSNKLSVVCDNDTYIDLLFDNIVVEYRHNDNPFFVSGRVDNLKGEINIISLKEGYLLGLNIKNIQPKNQTCKLFLSANSISKDDLREGITINDEYILYSDEEEINRDLKFDLSPGEKKEILIYIGKKHYFDSIYKELFADSLEGIDIVKYHDREFIDNVNEFMDSVEMITDNEELNRLLETCKVQISTKIFSLSEVNDKYFILLLSEIYNGNALKNYLERVFRDHSKVQYIDLCILRNYSKYHHNVEEIEKIMKYIHKIKLKDNDVIGKYLYTGNERSRVIDILSTDEEIVAHPLRYYILTKFLLEGIPQSIKDYVILKLTDENNEYKEIIMRIELNDYHYLHKYLLNNYDPMLSLVVFLNYFRRYVYIDFNDILNRIKIRVNQNLYEENKIKYKAHFGDDTEIVLTYDKETKHLEIMADTLKSRELDLDINEKCEIYVNNKKLPYSEKLILKL